MSGSLAFGGCHDFHKNDPHSPIGRGLNGNGLHRLCLKAWSPGSDTTRRRGLVGVGVPLWAGSEVSDAQARPSVTLFLLPTHLDVELSAQLRLELHVCLRAAMLPVMRIMD